MRSPQTCALSVGLLLCGLLPGCGGDEKSEGGAEEQPAAADEMREYFPMRPGMRWVYDVKAPEQQTQVQWDFTWPTSGDKLITQTSSSSGSADSGELVFRVKEAGAPPPGGGRETYDSGVLVEIATDTFMRYTHIAVGGDLVPSFIFPKQVFWAVREKPFGIHEVLLFEGLPAPAEAAPGSQAHQTRVLYFGPPFGDVQLLSSKVWLVREEPDENVPGYEGQPCQHFIRKYGDKEVPAFTEDLWYAKGKGLVRLEQKADGKTKLIQTLREFSEGAP